MLFRIICLLLLFLCGSACENIQNSPEPDPLMALPSAPVRLNLRNQREADIPFFSDLRLQDLQSQLTIEITAQPRHGSITPDTIRKVFVYRADPDWFGTDTAAFRVCSPLSCRNNPIYITLSDTGNACIPVAPDLTLQIPAGSQTTPLPVSLTCAGLVLNLTENPAPGQISLSGNSLVTAFPEFTSLIGTIGYRICNGAGLCDTGQITLVVQPDSSYCRNRFLPADDNIFILSNVVRKSVLYDSLFHNDPPTCPDDLIYESLAIVSGPDRGTAELRSNMQGRFLRYTRTPGIQAGTDSLVYSVRSRSGKTALVRLYFKIKS